MSQETISQRRHVDQLGTEGLNEAVFMLKRPLKLSWQQRHNFRDLRYYENVKISSVHYETMVK